MNLVDYLDIQREWSEIVFGEGPRVEGICKHIEKELKEVRADPADVVEWCDIAILALDGAWRAGFSPQQVCDAMVAKQRKNIKRKWHAQVSDDEPIVHVKESDHEVP